MVEAQANAFLERYTVVHQYPNDASGFSATLLLDSTTGQYTLSFRSTEYKRSEIGGDYERDAKGTDLEIDGKGFAMAQLVSMEHYWESITHGLNSDGTPVAADSALGKFAAAMRDANGNVTGAVNVTGYSLGGHLATVFTELHSDNVIQTYTFNGAGRGQLDPSIEYGGKTGVAALVGAFKDKLVAAGIEPWRDTTSNIYIKPSYASALYEVSQQFHLSGVASSPGAVLGADFAQKIIQLFGHATHDDAEYVANSGLHGVATALFVEDQPNVEGAAGYTPRFEWFTKLLDGDFGNTHSLTLVVDSLAPMDVLSRASPDLTLNQLNSIFAAASNQRATMQANNGNPKAAEGDSLEKVLDSLRKIFTRQAYATDPVTGSFRENGGFANRANRDKFYERLGEVSNAVKAQTDAGRTLKIVPLIGTTYGNDASGRMNTFVPRDLVDVLAGAKLTGADGLAYRYALKEKMPYDVDKDFAPVTLIATSPWVVVTSRNVPVNNVKELVDLAKAQPGKLSFGSSEPSSRLAGEQFKMQSKVSLTNIPYKGGAQIMTDVAGGHLEVGFTSVLTALQYYKSDRLRVLAVAGKRRSPSMPDIPTVTESGLPGYETFAWYGMYAPAGTPKEIRNKFQQEIARISNLPDVKARLLQLGAESAATTPDEFAAFTKNELVKYADLIKNAGIQRGD